ncbi:uncharacterized protein M421DRAFT_410134 [Didymella exigua CBS 183.55]|uniref:Uncharacterized protein n=1 Tax=Didymella exigua CBS 183.55 TaxID=1150837 RepID=A0A6A5R4K0_9PLEO|nr:uncharacterized protein M421DRAFT_410134 [Didymella exigua CBS 183.55]KAF1922612.1 hypothetical protein M421DRAFT_410134 [Didymella exigua CBS 183.55]
MLTVGVPLLVERWTRLHCPLSGGKEQQLLSRCASHQVCNFLQMRSHVLAHGNYVRKSVFTSNSHSHTPGWRTTTEYLGVVYSNTERLRKSSIISKVIEL